MNLFFIDQEDFKNDTIYLSKDDTKHLKKVLRLKEGDEIIIRDGNLNEADGLVSDLSSDRALISLSNKREAQGENKTFQVDLFQGIPKHGKLEQIIQKNTELGVSNFYPFFAHRSVIKKTENQTKKTNRYNRVAYEAGKQSRRGKIPVVYESLDFRELPDKLKDYDLILFAYELEEDQSLKEILKENKKAKRIALIIGPEGGFTEEEAKVLTGLGAQSVSLGKRILRTETAGMAAVSQINYEFE